MKDIIAKCLRPTVTAVIVRFKNGKYQFGTHIPAKAHAENPDTNHRCTVQGGIKEGESVFDAMQRELAEEYGENFAAACEITVINMSPVARRGKSGIFKLYHWCFIFASADVEPSPSEEVHRFFWDDVNDWQEALNCMSNGRAKTVEKLTTFLVSED